MTALENLIMRGLPNDWTDRDAEAFAKKVAPVIQENINAAVRHETAKRDGKHEDPSIKRWTYRLRDVMPDAE